MSAACNACYLASTEPEWLACAVVANRQDRPCEAHSEPAVTADDALREEIARALYNEGAFCGDCGGEPGEFYGSGCEGCRRVLHWYADAILPIVARVEQEAYRRGQAEAWEEGHRHHPQRGPSGCMCEAWSEGECACGQYGNGELWSLADNPYREQS